MTSVKEIVKAKVDFLKEKLSLIERMTKDDYLRFQGKNLVSATSIARFRNEFHEEVNDTTCKINEAMMENQNGPVTSKLLTDCVTSVASKNKVLTSTEGLSA